MEKFRKVCAEITEDKETLLMAKDLPDFSEMYYLVHRNRTSGDMRIEELGEGKPGLFLGFLRGWFKGKVNNFFSEEEISSMKAQIEAERVEAIKTIEAREKAKMDAFFKSIGLEAGR